MICGITMAICFLYWPQWGGMFCGPKVRSGRRQTCWLLVCITADPPLVSTG